MMLNKKFTSLAAAALATAILAGPVVAHASTEAPENIYVTDDNGVQHAVPTDGTLVNINGISYKFINGQLIFGQPTGVDPLQNTDSSSSSASSATSAASSSTVKNSSSTASSSSTTSADSTSTTTGATGDNPGEGDDPSINHEGTGEGAGGTGYIDGDTSSSAASSSSKAESSSTPETSASSTSTAKDSASAATSSSTSEDNDYREIDYPSASNSTDKPTVTKNSNGQIRIDGTNVLSMTSQADVDYIINNATDKQNAFHMIGLIGGLEPGGTAYFVPGVKITPWTIKLLQYSNIDTDFWGLTKDNGTVIVNADNPNSVMIHNASTEEGYVNDRGDQPNKKDGSTSKDNDYKAIDYPSAPNSIDKPTVTKNSNGQIRINGSNVLPMTSQDDIDYILANATDKQDAFHMVGLVGGLEPGDSAYFVPGIKLTQWTIKFFQEMNFDTDFWGLTKDNGTVILNADNPNAVIFHNDSSTDENYINDRGEYPNKKDGSNITPIAPVTPVQDTAVVPGKDQGNGNGQDNKQSNKEKNPVPSKQTPSLPESHVTLGQQNLNQNVAPKALNTNKSGSLGQQAQDTKTTKTNAASFAKSATNAATLPQTGESQTNNIVLSLIGGLLSAMSALIFGFGYLRKYKHFNK